MADRCLVCLGDCDAGTSAGELHAACARALFGSVRVPTIEVDPDQLYLFGQQMAGRTTLSGVQSKLSLGWHQKTLRVRAEVGAYILKPPSNTYPELPQNEHLCMRLAREFELDVAECGLVRLRNGALALLVKRFDREQLRGQPPRRLPMEDFCQLAEKLPREKYDGSAELCARIVRRYASDPGVDLLRLFRQLLFSWWIGNGDLHLKNLALLAPDATQQRVSPAYDLVSTRLLIADDPLALPIGGKRHNLDRADWLAFADYCTLPRKLADRELTRLPTALDRARKLIAASFLRAEFQAALTALLEERSARVG